jgi:hypothetical protein
MPSEIVNEKEFIDPDPDLDERQVVGDEIHHQDLLFGGSRRCIRLTPIFAGVARPASAGSRTPSRLSRSRSRSRPNRRAHLQEG